MLLKKTRYAIMASIRLAKEYGKGPILISDIAKSESIPQRFLENILLEMKNMGLLGSRIGKTGGYFLMRSPEEISLLEIVRHFEGTIALLHCVSEKAYQPCEFCKDETECKLRMVFKDVREYTFKLLQNTKLSDIMPNKDLKRLMNLHII
jgi:Rrf2 family protein